MRTTLGSQAGRIFSGGTNGRGKEGGAEICEKFLMPAKKTFRYNRSKAEPSPRATP